jgi:hypothetical protein
MLVIWILAQVTVVLTVTLRCLQALHAFNLPGTPTIFLIRGKERSVSRCDSGPVDSRAEKQMLECERSELRRPLEDHSGQLLLVKEAFLMEIVGNII